MRYEDWSIEQLERRVAELSAQKDALLAEAAEIQSVIYDRGAMKEFNVTGSPPAQVLAPQGIESEETVMFPDGSRVRRLKSLKLPERE